MSKPRWEDSPEWAQYLAMDKDCSWAWFQDRPEKDMEGAGWAEGTRWEPAKTKPRRWFHTLERRP